MAKVTFGSKWGRVRAKSSAGKGDTARSPEDVVRELKLEARRPSGEDYREKSLSIHGLVCARCGREFDEINRHLLTVHHKDGNHNYNPPDGSNWENLCVYCHEDVHSRGLLGDYLEGASGGEKEASLVYSNDKTADKSASGNSDFGAFGHKLLTAMEKKRRAKDWQK
ncbi:MAG: hypothetical protein A4E66_00832 [Syntrophus sp. PtaB.Bin001]|nr:MAG: hypothetical protein A4E66_00832 [Syntrophus sp. PtaB.Bin001]